MMCNFNPLLHIFRRNDLNKNNIILFQKKKKKIMMSLSIILSRKNLFFRIPNKILLILVFLLGGSAYIKTLFAYIQISIKRHKAKLI